MTPAGKQSHSSARPLVQRRRPCKSWTRALVASAALASLSFCMLPAVSSADPSDPKPTPSSGQVPATTKSGVKPSTRATKPETQYRFPGRTSNEQRADRRRTKKAPKGMAALAQWFALVEKQGTVSRAKSQRVTADVAALDRLAPRAVRELRRMPDADAQRLLMAVARSSMAPALKQSGTVFAGDPGFYFYNNLQYWLEQLATVSGARGELTFLPLLPQGRVPTLAQYQREVVADQDGDGIPDPSDTDADGDGLIDSADSAANVWSIPDVYLARPTRKNLPTWSSCLSARESITHLGSASAAKAFRTSRHCRLLDASESVAPANTSPPVVTGAPTVGSTLSATPGTWDGIPTPTFTYRWQYLDTTGGWADLTGANSSGYALQPSDLDHSVRVDVTGTNDSGDAQQASTPVTVAPAGAEPVVVTDPSVSGSPTVGALLTADPGTWTHSPTSYGYQWQSGTGGSWTAIAGATAQSYVPVAADVGDQLRVQVSANASSGQGTATSAATGTVQAASTGPVNTAMPTVTGVAAVGRPLSAAPGSWSGQPTFGYAWQRSFSTASWTAIPGATAASYTPVAADLNAVLRVEVTATSGSGSTTADSVATAPVTAASGACTVSPSTDTDQDGVPDCQELAGFTVTIASTGTGASISRKVTSDPTIKDTDGEGIPDGSEWQGSISDPSSSDTDGDLLNDYDELIAYESLPTNVDSDGDALIPSSEPRSVDPRLLDGTEVKGYPFAGSSISTSPTLSDTDGDSMSDWSELNTGGFNPLVADLPRLAVEVPSNIVTDIQIFTTRTDTSEKVSYTGSLSQSTDTQSTHTVDLTNVTTLNTTSQTWNAGIKGGYAKGKPYAEANLDYSHTKNTGTTTEQQTGFTKDSTQSTQQQYQSYVQDTQAHSVTVNPAGTLSTAVTLSNPGKIAYTASQLVVTAFQQVPGSPGALEPIATLDLPDAVSAGVTLAPGATKGPYQVSATDVSSDKLLGLLADPGSLIYEVTAPALTNPTTSESYAVVEQNVNAQTSAVLIDDGTGNPQTYRVATNVRRTPQGLASGLDLKTAMTTVLKQPYQTCALSTGQEVLCAVGSVTTTDVQHAWTLQATSDLTLGGDFDALTVLPGSEVRLTYLVDSDADQLYDLQENLYGTSPTNADTDADGLSDFAEVLTGWMVPAIGNAPAYVVYPNPLSQDIDGDLSWDACPDQAATCGSSAYGPESVRTTDPYLPDTNVDGVTDGLQATSDVLAYCPGCYRIPTFAAQWGSEGSGDGQFSSDEGLGGLAVDRKNGYVYVSDSGNGRVQKFDLTGKYLDSIGSQGTGDGQFTDVDWVAVDSAGNLYAADGGNETVSKFSSNGTFITDVGGLSVLNGLAVDLQNNVYVIEVSDVSSSRIVKYDSDLNPIGGFDLPDSGVTFDSPGALAAGTNGDLYVANTGANAPTGTFVGQLDPTGKLLASWNDPKVPLVAPAFFALDSFGHLYVTDLQTSLVHKFDTDGKVLAHWGGQGSGPGLFDGPAGIDVDNDCNVYVADSGNFRVQKLSYPNGCR